MEYYNTKRKFQNALHFANKLLCQSSGGGQDAHPLFDFVRLVGKGL